MFYPNPYYPPPPNPFREWTAYEDYLLISLAPTTAIWEIARILNRTIAAVYKRASQLGISLMPPDPMPFTTYLWG